MSSSAGHKLFIAVFDLAVCLIVAAAMAVGALVAPGSQGGALAPAAAGDAEPAAPTVVQPEVEPPNRNAIYVHPVSTLKRLRPILEI
jgi:hypothetical protein